MTDAAGSLICINTVSDITYKLDRVQTKTHKDISICRQSPKTKYNYYHWNL